MSYCEFFSPSNPTVQQRFEAELTSKKQGKPQTLEKRGLGRETFNSGKRLLLQRVGGGKRMMDHRLRSIGSGFRASRRRVKVRNAILYRLGLNAHVYSHLN